jgi:hypothetical protein
MTFQIDRFIALHMMYAQDGAARADQRAGDDEQVVLEHEAGRGRGPARVAVEHRHHDRHVGAADGRDQVHAEHAGDGGGDHQERPQLRRPGRTAPPSTTEAISMPG